MTDEEKSPYYMEGIPIPQTPSPGQSPAPWKDTRIIGKAVPRVDAYERVSGSAVYPSDVSLPNMLYGAILRCPHPHARVKNIEIGRAESMRGVHAVISGQNAAADLPWTYSNRGIKFESKLFDPHCRFEGETVAAVAAETPYLAQDALRAIAVEYAVLSAVSDERTALDQVAAAVHEQGNRVAPTTMYERGDVAKGFDEAEVVRQENYRTECEIHTPMELHGCVANWEGDRLTIWESTQGVYRIQQNVAETLKLPLSKVRVIGHYMGGGFGSKLQAGKYTIIAVLLAKITGRPVKMILTREETYLAVGNRPPSNMTLKAGIKKDGILTALDFACTGTGGAYPAGGTSLVDWQVRDLYKCPNVRTACTDVYINAGPARPFRAPGHPQGAWALEQMLDALAEAIGMDPVDLRLKNISLYSQARDGQPAYTSTGFKDCIEKGAAAFGWKQARQRIAAAGRRGVIRRGVGMAGGLWVAGGGRPPSTIILKLFADGSVNLNMGASDIGTGTKTVMALVVAEELGVKPDIIQIEHADTGSTQFATPSGGSKTVPTESPAVRAAAIDLKQQLLEIAARDLAVDPATLSFRAGSIVSQSDPSKKVAFTELSGLKQRGVVVGIGYRGPNPKNKVTNPFGAQFCEVMVNIATGEVRVVRFLGAHDSGRVMSRLTYDNQVFGGITMGIGLATTEARILDKNNTGKMLNRNWHDYKLPTHLDVPEDIVSLPIESDDAEANTTGAKGLGEPVTIPTAAAVANAVYHATGVRVTQTPINPVQLCRLLAEHRKEE
ncbi:MAG: xanthine dehydrogenase family protein molybdopterin-binding subunit [Deltaproteobacteria bacterium]